MNAELKKLLRDISRLQDGDPMIEARIWAAFQPERIIIKDTWTLWGERSEPKRHKAEFTLPPKRAEIQTEDKGPYQHPLMVTRDIGQAMKLIRQHIPDATITIIDRPDWKTAQLETRGHSRGRRAPSIPLAISYLAVEWLAYGGEAQ